MSSSKGMGKGKGKGGKGSSESVDAAPTSAPNFDRIKSVFQRDRIGNGSTRPDARTGNKSDVSYQGFGHFFQQWFPW